jgi:hypothetical protein
MACCKIPKSQTSILVLLNHEKAPKLRCAKLAPEGGGWDTRHRRAPAGGGGVRPGISPPNPHQRKIVRAFMRHGAKSKNPKPGWHVAKYRSHRLLSLSFQTIKRHKLCCAKLAPEEGRAPAGGAFLISYQGVDAIYT